ncbi:MAG: TIGR01620 family protein [Rhodobacteraceae bacterium]|nr:TIGR01620 family protein [Paracoccaceae bacterium]
MTKPQGPVLIEREGPPSAGPAEAPPVGAAAEDGTAGDPPEGRAMMTVAAALAGRRGGGGAGRFLLAALAAFAGFWASVAAWNFVAGLFATTPALGLAGAVLGGLLLLALLLVGLRELAGYRRLARLDSVHRAALAAIAANDLAAARRVLAELERLYAGRPETAWGRARLSERSHNAFDADALLHQAEAELLAPLDAAARREIEAAARQVAAVTALVPLALADVAAALTANLRMIRRIAEIYGGRAGTFGGWRLTRAVFSHLVATGLVAAGDDLVQSMAGGGLLARVSRRFGEGVVNGALTARVGVAAMEVCRPLPFAALPRPRVGSLVARALAGLFGRGRDAPDAAPAGQGHSRD